MKKMLMILSAVLVLCLSSSALACTTLYVGSAYTENGSILFSRSEDYSNSQNKVFMVKEAGLHKAGEVYNGCYGFTYTFTHDSYSYTAFRDDNLPGVCPDCGGTHDHTPYEAAGTNEKGVTVTATETIGSSNGVNQFDPFENLGIEEAEIVTVLLSEASSAKEALDILTGIYDTAGANNGSGIIIADANEAWYIENVTGHQYIAVKFSPLAVFVEPNMSIIGLIDLDDTENVVASEKLISLAVENGFFCGDEEKNIIDFTASYNAGQSANTRIKDALGFLNPALDAEDAAVYTITNIDENDNIIPIQTGITVKNDFTVKDFVDFYKIPTIGYERNLETHIFEIKDASAAGTAEWVALDDASCNVFVPYLPMLTTDTYTGCKLGTVTAGFELNKPESGIYYKTSQRMWTPDGVKTVEGYVTLPENWKDSYYWSYDALTNLVKFGGFNEAQVADVKAQLAALQDSFYEQYASLLTGDATAISMDMAKQAHEEAIALVEGLLSE